jgi:hypothetical protein
LKLYVLLSHVCDLVRYWFESVEDNKTRVTNVTCLDPHAPLPSWITNWLVVNVAYLIIPMLYKQAKQYAPDGKLHHHVLDNPAIYNELRSRLDILKQSSSVRSPRRDNHPRVSAYVTNVEHHTTCKDTDEVNRYGLQSCLATVSYLLTALSVWAFLVAAVVLVINGGHPSQCGIAYGLAVGLWCSA